MRNMSTVMDVRHQLAELCGRVGLSLVSAGVECSEAVRRALISGLFLNVAEHIGEGKYLTVSSHTHTHTHTLHKPPTIAQEPSTGVHPPQLLSVPRQAPSILCSLLGAGTNLKMLHMPTLKGLTNNEYTRN